LTGRPASAPDDAARASAPDAAAASAARDLGWTLGHVGAVDDLDPAEWDACVPDGDPFVSHAWLSALEASGSIGAAQGWTPRHLLARTADGRLAAAAPVYRKTHSRYEIGSDFGWALAHERAVGPYFPKLQVEAPASPVTGPRLLVGVGEGAPARRTALAGALVAQAAAEHASSLHLTFLTLADWRAMRAQGLLCDFGVHYAWRNRGYADFAAFLRDVKSSRRTMIRSERRAVQSSGLTLERLEGDAITPEVIDAFVPHYLSTFKKYGHEPTLTASFLHRIRDTMRDRLMFAVARSGGEIVAATMFAQSATTLYALFWGGGAPVRFLHFELTYYMAIDHALERGLALIDAGPLGDHKAVRGFGPEPSLAAHWFRDTAFTAMVRPGMKRRTATVRGRIEDLRQVQSCSSFDIFDGEEFA
jgi:hypothetical protein